MSKVSEVAGHASGTLDPPSAPGRSRVVGAVYLLYFLIAIGGALIPPGLTAPGGLPLDAAQLAAKITGNPTGYRLEIATGLLSTALYVALIALLYGLLKRVSRTVAVLMLAFGLIGCAVTAVENLLQLSPLVVLGDASYLSAFTTAQLQAQALLLVHLAAAAGSVALVFFGCFQLCLGWLVYRSTFVPRVIGVVVGVAGIGWLTYLYAPLAAGLALPLALLGFAAELSLMLWLLIKGVEQPNIR